MRKLLLLWIAGFGLMTGATAQAEARAFYGIGGSLMSFDDGFDEVEPKNAYFRLGA